MKYDKSKVYTSLTADELNPGDKVIVADSPRVLRQEVEEDGYISTLKGVLKDCYIRRFATTNEWCLAYLIERKYNCTNCKGCVACIKPDKTFVCEDWKPKTKRNLCDSCKHSFADCPATPDDVKFGDGVGDDNVYECDKYEKKAEMPELISLGNGQYAEKEKHFRPFRDTDELVKVWEQKWSEKTNGQKWHDCKMNMPHIWVRRKESNSKGQLITEFGDELHVSMGKEGYNMTDLLVYFTFLDGTPCGVEE